MDREWCGDALLGHKQAFQVGIQFTNLVLTIGARSGHTVTTSLTDAREVIALVGSEHKQGVALIDAIVRKAVEEGSEGIII